jgi:hypothetical protein
MFAQKSFCDSGLIETQKKAAFWAAFIVCESVWISGRCVER